MRTYRLRYERWRQGIGRRGGRFAPFYKDFDASTRKAAIQTATEIWTDIRTNSVSTRFVELIEVVDWAPEKRGR